MTGVMTHHRWMSGGEPVVLAFSGLRSTYLELQPLLKALKGHGYSVSSPQLSGYGFSADPETLTWQDWLAEALKHFDDLASKHRQVFVCGLSMGATLALAVAAERGGRVAGAALRRLEYALVPVFKSTWLLYAAATSHGDSRVFTLRAEGRTATRMD